MNKTKNLLVLIVTYNHQDYIKNCLESVLEQNTKYNINIICFDDCSTDEYFKKYSISEKIQVIKNKKNLGKGRFSIMENANKYSKIMTIGQY